MKLTIESRKKISETLKRLHQEGKLTTFKKGHKFSEETIKKISETVKFAYKRGVAMGFKSGEENYSWKHGLSKRSYPSEWNNLLKEKVRARCEYVCHICWSYGNHVHHIDYNKKNCDSKNLITLCHSCHMKTNFNRSYWIKYFNDLEVCRGMGI